MTRPRPDEPRPAHEQGSAERLLEDPALVEPAVLAQVEALVGRVDDDGVVGQPLVVEELQQAADPLVDGLDAAEVVVEVAVVLPAHEVLALEIGLAEGGIARLVVGVPGLALLGRQLRGA